MCKSESVRLIANRVDTLAPTKVARFYVYPNCCYDFSQFIIFFSFEFDRLIGAESNTSENKIIIMLFFFPTKSLYQNIHH